MKNWGWVLLLTIGCLLSAVIVVIVIEKIKDLPFFATNEMNSAVTINSYEPVIDESASSPSRLAFQQPAAIIPPIIIDQQPTSTPNNLISNPSFELNPLTTVPIWQTTGKSSQHIVEWSSEHASNGEHALKTTATHPSNRGWPGWQTQLDHTANNGYLLQAKYYTTDGANAWLELSFLDSDNRLIKGFSTGCPRSSIKNKWTMVERKVKTEWIPAGTRVVKIALRQCLNHTKGRPTTLYFDEVSLQYLSEKNAR